jgi:hypothetical protein
MKVEDLKRRTTLELSELTMALKESEHMPCLVGFSCSGNVAILTTIPTGLVVNEIGIVFLKEKNAEAEEVLLEALEMKNREISFPAYGYLASARGLGVLSKKGEVALSDFEDGGERAKSAAEFVTRAGLIR